MTADRDLLATVAESIGGDPDQPDGAWDIAELAVWDTGRWLAERLRAKANEVQVAIDNAGDDTADRRRWINMESTYRLAANLVLAACGVPESAEGGRGDG